MYMASTPSQARAGRHPERVTNVRLVHLRIGSTGTEPAADPIASRLAELDVRSVRASDPAGIDAALGTLDGERVLVDADLAGLNLALHRMMRKDLLGAVETAVLTREPIGYLRELGLPAGRADQLELARTGRTRLVGVIKDDSGGVCVDAAELTPWTPGQPWWVRAVVDDQRLCDGEVRSLSVRRLGPSELRATVRLGRFRARSCRGRSLQLACDEARIVSDGRPRERPRAKRTFWSEPQLWLLATPDAGQLG
jgi:hypothetical protein